MKGIVFTEFLEMAESKYGLETVDKVIQDSNLPNQGAYTSVGTYDSSELLKMVGALGTIAKSPIKSLLIVFGHHLAKIFAAKYPDFFYTSKSLYDFLKKVDDHIHSEVRKLYPEAELPRFRYEEPDPDTFIFIYQSERPLADLAQGLIEGCIARFNEKIKVEVINLGDSDGRARKFILTRE